MTEKELLLAMLDQAYNRRSWHGTNLRGSIRSVDPELASWRPAPGRHSIHEVVVHAAYWKYAARRRLTGESRGSFPLKGSNWFPRAGTDASVWRDDVKLLDDCHRSLRAAIEALPGADLERRSPGSPFTNTGLITGAAAHDLYHAGQIQLLKRLKETGAHTGFSPARKRSTRRATSVR
jgi:hypothetical protein